ncbi:TetR/AcrR family transcriptional regulator [Sandarakinorhabdus sp. DWP1-3-1]|uniref:TetR/AcrR family transcriptional regulator n=1 Tax=Sandarakinorhabdus sp. DWP1-3-1 TaxID=2804627 RepID=UPI003CEC492B
MTNARHAALAGHPDKPLLYSSPSILDRRRRILKEARKIIAEVGFENFSVRELCVRAGIAHRTLYNAFHSKDRVIAIAIRQAFDDFNGHVRHRTDQDTVAGVLDRTIAINRRNFGVRNYTKAVCAIYFGPNTPRDVWQTLQHMSLVRIREWLDVLRSKDQLQDWVSIDHLADTMANVQYSTINDWCLGRLGDEEYLQRLTENMLLLIIGAVKGEARTEAETFLFEMQRTGAVPAFPPATWAATKAAA